MIFKNNAAEEEMRFQASSKGGRRQRRQTQFSCIILAV